MSKMAGMNGILELRHEAIVKVTDGACGIKYIAALRIDAPPDLRLAALLKMDVQYRAKLKEDGISLAEDGHTFLVLSFSTPDCTCSVTYKHPLDVPLVDVICEHGNYLLRWVDSSDKN